MSMQRDLERKAALGEVLHTLREAHQALGNVVVRGQAHEALFQVSKMIEKAGVTITRQIQLDLTHVTGEHSGGRPYIWDKDRSE